MKTLFVLVALIMHQGEVVHLKISEHEMELECAVAAQEIPFHTVCVELEIVSPVKEKEV